MMEETVYYRYKGGHSQGDTSGRVQVVLTLSQEAKGTKRGLVTKMLDYIGKNFWGKGSPDSGLETQGRGWPMPAVLCNWWGMRDAGRTHWPGPL